MKNVVMVAFLALFISGCANLASIQKSWKDENAVIDAQELNKVLVVSLLKSDVNRKDSEDKLAALLKGKGVTSYNYLPASVKESDEEKVKQMIAKDGFDGAIIMRLLDVDKDVQYVPGNISTFPFWYRTYGGYYVRSWQTFQNEGYYSNTKTYSIETNIYSVKKDKIIYSALSTYTNPSTVGKAIEGAANAVFKEMKKQGFLVNTK